MIELSGYLERLHGEFDCIQAVAIADLDGNPLRVIPADSGKLISYCAAFGGIALRRLSVSERLSGRAETHQITIQGSDNAVIARRLSEQLQFVVTLSGSYAAAEAQSAIVATLEQIGRLLSRSYPENL